jgi:hypothetical protein
MKKTFENTAIGLAGLMALALSTACSATDESAPRPFETGEKTEVAPQVRTDWVGHRLGASAGRWFYRGTLEKAPEGAQPPTITSVSSEPSTPLKGPDSFAVIGEDGDVHEVVMPSVDLQKVASELAARGWANGTPSTDETLGDEVEKGWSSGTDNRIPRGLHELGLGSSAANRTGQLDANCSATFVGTPETDYYVITAAHCLFEKDTGAWLDPDFIPRRDSCRTNTGAAIANCDTRPYGTWDGGVYMTYQFYLDNCRGVNTGTQACLQRDIALIRVSRPANENFPGAYGFGTWSSDELSAFTKLNRGYPNCGGDGDPDDTGGSAGPNNVCRSSTLYGDANACSLGSFSNPDGDGWNRNIRHSCDASGGMSGGPMYFSSGGLFVFGVNIAETTGCFDNCTETRPNVMRRITPEFYGFMLNFRGI